MQSSTSTLQAFEENLTQEISKNKIKQKSLSEREGIIQEKKNALISFMRDI